MPFKAFGSLIPEIGIPLQMGAQALDNIIPRGNGMNKRKRGRPCKKVKFNVC